MAAPCLTLLTDYGISDPYVAILKGVIMRIAPQVQMIDVAHQIPPQNILAGAIILNQSVDWFPDQTVHVAIVDPGVGTGRRILAGRWGHQLIVAPDNGLVSFVQQRKPSAEVYEVTNRAYFLPEVSCTFHGRDVIAPVAAHLACGQPLASVGPKMTQPLTIHLPQPRRENNRLMGEIIYVDHFGNLITNISAAHVGEFQSATIHIRNHSIGLLRQAYGQAAVGELLALVGSSGLLEIAVNQGHAGQLLNAGLGDEVTLIA